MKSHTPTLETSHFPVLLNEIIKICSPTKGDKIIDCTFGGGGYSKALLNFSDTEVIGFDRDTAVVSIAKNLEKKFPNRFKFYSLKFSQLDEVINNKVDYVIFDLGVSSFQIKNLKRGFSFNSKEKLDMDMGLSDLTAEDVVNNLSETDLKLVIKVFGEEKEASKIAKNIVEFRRKKKITKVNELVQIIESSKKINSKINPSTKTFQALRMFVNKEISELLMGIVKATKLLKPGGKILVVSFHSIEDKIIKYFFSNFSKNKSKPSRYFPEKNSDNNILFEKYTNKVIRPSKEELVKNNSSRSAKLRFVTRSEDYFQQPNELFKKFSKYLKIEDRNV